MTTDGTQHYQALSALEGEGIPFQEKTQAMGHKHPRARVQWARRGSGPAPLFCTTSTLKKADLERARHALGTAGVYDK